MRHGRDERSPPKLELQAAGGGFRLSGIKQLVPYASAAQVLLVSTVTEEGEVAIVAIDTDDAGITLTRNQTLGADPLFEVKFEAVPVTN